MDFKILSERNEFLVQRIIELEDEIKELKYKINILKYINEIY